MTTKLPPLPIPDRGSASCSSVGHSNEAMQSYAKLAVRDALERAEKCCESIAKKHLTSGRYASVVADHSVRAGGQVDGAEECASAIDALLKEYSDE